MKEDQKYPNYTASGYNGFFRRTIASQPSEFTLSDVGANRTHKPQDMNLDNMKVSGRLGDVFQVGNSIELNGPAEKIALKDPESNEVIRLGNGEL